MKCISHSETATKKIGKEFATKLRKGDTVLLYGDLGFGKTTFVKGVAEGLGVHTRIISPTFPIIRTHEKFHHIDLYRIEDEKELQSIGLFELFEDKELIKIIEWAEKLKNIPEKRWEVKFSLNKDNVRTINIIKHE